MRASTLTHSILAHLIAGIALGCAGWTLAAGAQGSGVVPRQQNPAPQTADQTPSNHEVADAAPITEEELRQQLLGKTLYLRGGWLNDNLHFDEQGKLDGSSPQASFTLSLVEITRVHLTKHRLELEGDRYGLHFLGALPTEVQSNAFDKVRLTSKKKPLRLSIDRESVEKPKKEKHGKRSKAEQTAIAGSPAQEADTAAGQIDKRDVTHSVADANRQLRSAIDRIFSSGMDARMIANLPQYWQLYYRAVATHAPYQPSDLAVLRQNQVDRKAKLLKAVDPPSNDYAQKNGVAGIAMYHVVVGADGAAKEIAVGRPIGFGLDENAVAAIRKATFEPAMKDGKPVPVLLNLLVEFRIYSKRTAAAAGGANLPAGPILPGPYTANRPKGP